MYMYMYNNNMSTQTHYNIKSCMYTYICMYVHCTCLYSICLKHTHTHTQGVQGTGMGGRIVSRDVLQATPTTTTMATPTAEFTDIDLTGMRRVTRVTKSIGVFLRIPSYKLSLSPPPSLPLSLPLHLGSQTIARRLVEAKQTIPHFNLTIDVVMDKLLEYVLYTVCIYEAS